MTQLSIFDLKEMDETELLSRVDKTLRHYQILREIYDNSFLENLFQINFIMIIIFYGFLQAVIRLQHGF